MEILKLFTEFKNKKSKFSQICQRNQFSRERDRLKRLPILIYQTIRWVTKRQPMEKKSTMMNQSTRMDMMSSRRTEREKRKPERLLQDVRFSSSRSSLRWKSIWARVSGRKWPNCWAWQRRRWANELIKLFRRAHVSAKSLRVERWKIFEPLDSKPVRLIVQFQFIKMTPSKTSRLLSRLFQILLLNRSKLS